MVHDFLLIQPKSIVSKRMTLTESYSMVASFAGNTDLPDCVPFLEMCTRIGHPISWNRAAIEEYAFS
jgi:hypothetical protein